MQSFDHCEKTKYTQRQGRIQEFVQGGGGPGPKEINRFHWSRGVPPPNTPLHSVPRGISRLVLYFSSELQPLNPPVQYPTGSLPNKSMLRAPIKIFVLS